MQPLLGKRLAECALVGERFQTEQAIFRVVQQLRAKGIDQHRSQFGVGLIEPTAEGDTVGFVIDPVRIELVQFGEHGFAHQLRVQPGHAIDAVGAEECQVAHAHAAAVVFFDQ